MTLPPCVIKFRDFDGWIIVSIACDISIEINDKFEAGSEFLASIHADPVHVLAERPDKNWNGDREADCSSHTNIGKTTFLKRQLG